MIVRSARQTYGHRPDPVDHKYNPIHLLVGAGSHGVSGSLESFAPGIKDQGQTGRCVGFGMSGALYTSAQGMLFEPSPTKIYIPARAIDRSRGADNKFPPLVDEGSEPNQAVRAMNLFGVEPIDPAIDGPVIADEDLNAEPSLESLEKESAHRALLVEAYALDPDAPDFENQIARTIDKGYAITAALPTCDDAYETYNGGVLSATSGQIYGGHENFWIGYEFTPSGAFRVRGQNSWGDGWGLAGRFEGDSIYARRHVDVIAMKVSNVVKSLRRPS